MVDLVVQMLRQLGRAALGREQLFALLDKGRNIPGDKNHGGRRQGRNHGREANRLSADVQAVLHLHRAAAAEGLGDVVQEEVSLLGREDLVHGPPQQFLGRPIEQVGLGGHDLQVAALRVHIRITSVIAAKRARKRASDSRMACCMRTCSVMSITTTCVAGRPR